MSDQDDEAPQSVASAQTPLPPLELYRSLFQSSSYSAPAIVESVCQRVLMSAGNIGGGQGRGGGFGASTSASSPTTTQQQQDEVPQEVHQSLASRLVFTIEDAEAQLAKLYGEEQQLVRRAEGDARAIEASKKSLLNQVRVALNDGTSQRIRSMEDAIGNALTSTVGVEQHLNQSNSRVTRGRVVSLLLKYFQMFSHIDGRKFDGVLENLSRARKEQRTRTTEQWANGDVSYVEPKYYTTLQRGVDLQSPSRSKKRSHTKRRKSKAKEGGDDSDDVEEEEEPEDSEDDDDGDNGAAAGAGGLRDEDIPPPENATVASGKVPLHRYEMAAVADGLDRLFASRYYTEAQVPWALKLNVLRKELDSVHNAGNIEKYLDWLREELDEDCTHLMQAFRAFYDESGESAVHSPYGKSLLKTLELSGRLYGSLSVATAADGDVAQDDATALLDYVIQESAKDLAQEMLSAHQPKVPPPQPKLPELTISTLMSFFDRDTKPGIVELYDFLEQKVKREILVVESVVAGCFGRDGQSSVAPAAASKGGSKHVRSLSGENPIRRTLSGSLSTIAASSMSAKQKQYMHSSSTGMMATGASTGGLGDAGGRQARQQLLYKIVDKVLRRYVTSLQQSAGELLQTLTSQEGALTPRSKRRSAVRVADAMAYSHSVTAELYALCEDFFGFLDEEYGATTELQLIFDVIPSLFPHQAEYVSERQEVNLLKRYILAIDEKYSRALLVPSGAEEPFDVLPVHSQKAQDYFERMEEVCQRVITLTPPSEVPLYIIDIMSVGVEAVAAYLNAEADKMLRSVKEERGKWNRAPKDEGAWMNPSARERQLCAARMVLFAQVTIMKLHEHCASMAIQAHLGGLAAEGLLDFTSREDFQKLDDTLEDLVNLVAAAIVTKSLVILTIQDTKHDFQSGDSKNAVVSELPCTRACALFCQYMSFQLRSIQPLLEASCGQLWLQTLDDAGAATGTKPSDGGDPPRSPTLGPNSAPDLRVGGDIDRSMTSLRTRRDAVVKVKKMSLQQLIFGDGGPTSLVRSIGVPVYRGLCAHFRSIRDVTDAGALVYKHDLTEYVRALRPLMDAPGVDSLIVEQLMMLLKETSGLLLAAMNNIKDVKAAGLIGKLMSNDEKVEYLRMRFKNL